MGETIDEKTDKRDLDILDSQFGTEYKCYLNYETPWQLLAATMLSAQCTDARVNIVTKDLFQKYTSPGAIGGGRSQRIGGGYPSDRILP